MPSKIPPLSVRLRPELREPLAAYLTASGQARNEFVNQAIEEKLENMSVTDEQIESLGQGGAGHGDLEMAAISYLAIHGEMPSADEENTGHIPLTADERERVAAMGQTEARARCAEVIAAAKAMRD